MWRCLGRCQRGPDGGGGSVVSRKARRRNKHTGEEPTGRGQEAIGVRREDVKVEEEEWRRKLRSVLQWRKLRHTPVR
jgi:hypothetical protein